MFERIRAWYGTLPDPVKAGAATFFFAFMGIFGLAAVGWLQDVANWATDLASSAPDARPFPDLAVLSAALFAGVTAGILAVLNTLGRTIQRAVSWVPGSGPAYPEVPVE